MTTTRPEFSRRVPVSRIGAGGLEPRIEATADECRALAQRLQLPAVASLSCRFRLSPPVRGEVSAEAELRAEVTQVCVVSLEPFEATVGERFALRFVPEQAGAAASRDLPQDASHDDLDLAAPDELAYAGDAIDLGEAAAEQLALALDPYPRMPGIARPPEASEAAAEASGDEASSPPHPFAALARLRGGPRSGDA